MWTANGGTISREKMVEHWDETANFHQSLEAFEERGIAVRFWRLDRKWNSDAHQLANDVLGEMKPWLSREVFLRLQRCWN